MDLDQLRGFVHTARERSFTRAARKLFLTQPAVSLQIKALETELGQRLLERQGGRVRLTPAGEILFARAEQILSLVARAGEDLAELDAMRRGRLDVVASDTTCATLLPPVIQAFRARFPGIDIRLTDRMSADVGALVGEGVADLGLATMPVTAPGLTCEPLFRRRDVAIAVSGHALLGRSRVTVKRLCEEPFLMLSSRSTSRRLTDAWLSECGVTARVSMELESVEVIKRYVEIGLGVAIVPEAAVADETRAGRLGVVAVKVPEREIAALYRPGGPPSRASRAFLDALREHAGHGVMRGRARAGTAGREAR